MISKIFSPKNWWKIGVLTKKTKRNYTNIGFWEKRQFIAENCPKSQKIVIITSIPVHCNYVIRFFYQNNLRRSCFDVCRNNTCAKWSFVRLCLKACMYIMVTWTYLEELNKVINTIRLFVLIFDCRLLSYHHLIFTSVAHIMYLCTYKFVIYKIINGVL
jgi:hypothetical protein